MVPTTHSLSTSFARLSLFNASHAKHRSPVDTGVDGVLPAHHTEMTLGGRQREVGFLVGEGVHGWSGSMEL